MLGINPLKITVIIIVHVNINSIMKKNLPKQKIIRRMASLYSFTDLFNAQYNRRFLYLLLYIITCEITDHIASEKAHHTLVRQIRVKKVLVSSKFSVTPMTSRHRSPSLVPKKAPCSPQTSLMLKKAPLCQFCSPISLVHSP